MLPDIKKLAAVDCRRRIAENLYNGPTAALAAGNLQANLVVLPQNIAEDFHTFCRHNIQACPLLEVTSPGEECLTKVAAANVATDFPAYFIFKDGKRIAEVNDLSDRWQDDFVSFIIGCSYTTDYLLQQQGFVLPHLINNTTIPIYITDQLTHPSKYFSGPLAVSMRYIPRAQLQQAVELTANYPLAHGAPIHIDHPEHLGIGDISQPNYGVYYPPEADDIPVFWACGITPQLCMHAEVSQMITHKPGHMLVCDLKNTELYQRSSI